MPAVDHAPPPKPNWVKHASTNGVFKYPFFLLTIDVLAERFPAYFTGDKFPDEMLSLVKSLKMYSLTLDQKGCRALLMRQPMRMGRNPALWATPRNQRPVRESIHYRKEYKIEPTI
ncbi:hypothetical protein FOTG_19134 [Fusarium oxysporum f. sp. vasinfectum 25433]|uniref:Uncharacterized protein n=1 Tax=Fusarium oxysporum f. sp. vasinfectum 25433 TaxID=1089449 RepID=X0KFL1_FUSOX|nr:hypothetical protein FOTG_19134 [Fusarium oxysporum f. sp. vasinfectum 25433]